MTGWKVRRLRMVGVRSFEREATIDFPESGIVLLDGKNHDTKGSSGSGKSTVNLALAHVLGISPFPATSLQSWFEGAPVLDVSAEFYRGTEEMVLQRGRKTSLKLSGVDFRGSAAQIAEEVAKRLGPTDILRALTYRGQRQRGLFLSHTDEGKKEFLTQVLDLGRFEAEAERAGERVRKAEGELATLAALAQAAAASVGDEPGSLSESEAMVATARAALASVMGAEERAAAHVKERDDRLRAELSVLSTTSAPAIAEAQHEIARLNHLARNVVAGDEVNAALEKAREVVAAVSARLQAIESEERARMVEYDRARGAQRAEIQSRLVAAADLGRAQQDERRLAASIAAATADICPTCEQYWDRAEAHRAKLQDELQVARARVATAEAARTEAGRLQLMLDGVPPFEPSPLASKFIDAKQGAMVAERLARENVDRALDDARSSCVRDVVEAEARLANLVAARASSEANARARADVELMPLRAAAGEAIVAVSNARSVVTMAEAEHREMVAALDRHEKAKAAAELARQRVEHAEVKANVERDFAGLVGRTGFLGSVFDEILQEISHETNQVLASVANTRHCTFEFRSENTTKAGTVQRRIVPIITVDGHSAEFQYGLSGGMQAVVELAVDLAVGAVVARRSGACPGWLVLDECFEGLGPVEKESCIAILQLFAQDRLVLVVDHGSEFKSMFSAQVTVEFSQGRSWIATTNTNTGAAHGTTEGIEEQKGPVRRPRRRVQGGRAGGGRRQDQADGLGGIAEPRGVDGGQGEG